MKIDLEQYGFREGFDWDNRFILKTQIGQYEISTVDLGLNHQFTKGLPPLYYETMIFMKYAKSEIEINPFEGYQKRYTTEEEARVGHEKAIEYVKEHLKEGSNE